MDKSLSESNLNDSENVTPPNYIAQRLKRKREGYELEELKNDMIEMVKSMLLTQENELKKITPTIMEIKKTNSKIEDAVSFLSAQNDEFKKKLEQMDIQSKKDREYINILEDKIEDLQRRGRKSNIELKNVPKKEKESKEDLINMALCLTKTINSGILKTDIKDIYRVKSRKREVTNTPIVVELSSTILKTDILKSCKTFNIKQKVKLCAKHLGLKYQEDTPIYVSEQLTTKGARLFFLARDLAKAKSYKYCWTAYGNIYIKKQDDSPTYVVKSETQIQQLMQEK